MKKIFNNSNWNCQALYHEPLARVIAQALPVFGIKFAFTFFTLTCIFLVCNAIGGHIHDVPLYQKPTPIKQNILKQHYKEG